MKCISIKLELILCFLSLNGIYKIARLKTKFDIRLDQGIFNLFILFVADSITSQLQSKQSKLNKGWFF